MNFYDEHAQINNGPNYQKLMNVYNVQGSTGTSGASSNHIHSNIAVLGAREAPPNVNTASHFQNLQYISSLNSSQCDVVSNKNHNFSNKMPNNSHNYHDESSKAKNINGQNDIYHQQLGYDEHNVQNSHVSNRLMHQYKTQTHRDTTSNYMYNQTKSKGQTNNSRVGEKENKLQFKNSMQQPSSRLPLSYNNGKEVLLNAQQVNQQRLKTPKNAQITLTSPPVKRSGQIPQGPNSTSSKVHSQQQPKNKSNQYRQQNYEQMNGQSKMGNTQTQRSAAVTGQHVYYYKQKEQKAPQKSCGAHPSGRVGKKQAQCSMVERTSGLAACTTQANPMSYEHSRAIFCATARVGNQANGLRHDLTGENQQQAYIADQRGENGAPSMNTQNLAGQLSGLSNQDPNANPQQSYLHLLNNASSTRQDSLSHHQQHLDAQAQPHLQGDQHSYMFQEAQCKEKQPSQSDVDIQNSKCGSQTTRAFKPREQYASSGQDVVQNAFNLQNHSNLNQTHRMQAERQTHRVNWVDQTAMDTIPEKSRGKAQMANNEIATHRNKSPSGFTSAGGESVMNTSQVAKQRQTTKYSQTNHQQYMLSQTQTIPTSSSQSKLNGSMYNGGSKTAQCPSSSRIFQFQGNQSSKPMQTSTSRTARSKGAPSNQKESNSAITQSNSIYNNYKSFIEKQKKIVAQLSQSKFQSANNGENVESKQKPRKSQRAYIEQPQANSSNVASDYQSNANQRQTLSSTQKLRIQNEMKNEFNRTQQLQPSRRQHNSGAATHRRDFIQENKRLSGQTHNQNTTMTNNLITTSNKKSTSQNQMISKGSTKNLQIMTQFNNQRKQNAQEQQSRQVVNASAISGLTEMSNSAVQVQQRKQMRTAQGVPALPSAKKALSSSRVGAAGGKSPKNSAFSFYEPRPSLQTAGLSKQTSKGKLGLNRQSILNQTIGVVQQTNRKRKTSEKSGKVSISDPSAAGWTHRGGHPKTHSNPVDIETKLRKNTSSQNIKAIEMQNDGNYEHIKNGMAHTHNPEAMTDIFKTLQIQQKTPTAEFIPQSQQLKIQQEVQDYQTTSNHEPSEESRGQLVLQQQLLLSAPGKGSKPYQIDEVQNLLVNSRQQSKQSRAYNNTSMGAVLLASSRQQASPKKSGCFGNFEERNFENDESAVQHTQQEIQITEKKSSGKMTSPNKKIAKQDKENHTNEKPKQAARNQDENACKVPRMQVQESNPVQVLQQNNNKQNIHPANNQETEDANQQKPAEQQQQAADPNLNDTMIFSKNSCLDDYIIGKQIGQGAYAVVRIGLHKPTNQKVAMKIYKKYKLEEPNRRRSVKREIKLMERMRHQNIIQLYEIIDTSKYVILVMEYVGGGSLHGYLKSKPQRRLEEWDAKRIFKQILEGLKYCHTRCITHRDIKLENLLLDDKNNIKIIDFGFSTCIPNDKKIKIFCGTPSYMAPEIVLKTEYCGPPADIWALGVLLFTILSGQFPYRGATDEELYNKICKADYHLPSVVQSSLSSEVKDLLAKLFSIKADERPSARDLLQHPWLQNIDNVENSRELKEGSINQLHAQEYLPAQKRAKSQRLDGAASTVAPKKQNYQTQLNTNRHEEKAQETTPFNPFKMLAETPQNQQRILFSPSNQQIPVHAFSPTMIRSNSHVIVGQKGKNHEQKQVQLNENVVKAIVDKLGYSSEEVRYLVLNSQDDQGQKTEEENSGLVVTLYNRLLAEEQEKERQAFAATQRSPNPVAFSNNAVSQTSLGLSAHGPPEGSNGQHSQGFFGIGNLQQKFGVQPSYVPSLKSLNSNGASSYLNISNNEKVQQMNTNMMLNSSSSKTLQNGEPKDVFGNVKLHPQNHQFGHQMMVNNFFKAPADNSCNASRQEHQQPPFIPQSRPCQNHETYPESPDFNKTQKTTAVQHIMTKQAIELSTLNALECEADGGQQFGIVVQRSKTPKTINNYGVSQRMQQI